MEYFICTICCTFLAIIAFYKKKFTKWGTLLAWLLGIIISYCGGYQSFALLVLTFIFIVLIGKISRNKRNEILSEINQKHGTRDAVQVFANISIATFSLIIFYITKNSIFYIAYACVLASSLADTMASDIGVLSKNKPIDICRFKRIESGLSGGINLLGLTSALTGSFAIGFTYFIFHDYDVFSLLFITLLGFIGTIVDSICGSLIQVKYQCIQCKKRTEKKVHCNNKTKHISGFIMINNDVVNILNNSIIFLLSITFQILLK